MYNWITLHTERSYTTRIIARLGYLSRTNHTQIGDLWIFGNTRGHSVFDKSPVRGCTRDHFRINERTRQVDTLDAVFVIYGGDCARWGMARWNSSEVSLTMHHDGAVRRAKSAKSFEQSSLTVILYAARALPGDVISRFHDSSDGIVCSLPNGFYEITKGYALYIFHCTNFDAETRDKRDR